MLMVSPSCEQTRLAALVDPGGDAEKIKQEVDDSGLTLMQILLTHGHLDHVGAAAELAQHYGVPVFGPEKEDWSNNPGSMDFILFAR